MSDFQKTRRVDITIYFTNSPSPVQVKNVCHIGTEGGLLRVITNGGADAGGQTQWWPLVHIFNIREDARRNVGE